MLGDPGLPGSVEGGSGRVIGVAAWDETGEQSAAGEEGGVELVAGRGQVPAVTEVVLVVLPAGERFDAVVEAAQRFEVAQDRPAPVDSSATGRSEGPATDPKPGRGRPMSVGRMTRSESFCLTVALVVTVLPFALVLLAAFFLRYGDW